MAWDYTDKLKEHFYHPRNVLEGDEADFQADGVGTVGNIKCGDMMKMYIKVDKDERITDCKWKTYGCASAIGSTSVLSEMVIGKTLEEALKIGPKEIAEELGGLPQAKIHCSVLGHKALRAAIEDYFRHTGQENRITWAGREIVCQCLNVSREEIEEAVASGVTDFSVLQDKTKVGTGCGSCVERVKALLEEYRQKYYPVSAALRR